MFQTKPATVHNQTAHCGQNRPYQPRLMRSPAKAAPRTSGSISCNAPRAVAGSTCATWAILEHERACDGTGTAAALKAGDKENRNGLKAGSL